MKKIFLVLIITLLAGVVFAQSNDPFLYLQDDQVIIVPQRAIPGKPYVNKVTGSYVQPIEGYKLTLLIKKEFDDKILDGYVETVSIRDNAPFTVQIDNDDGTFSYNDQIISDLEEIEWDKEMYWKVLFILPPNYSKVFFSVDSVFTPEDTDKEFREEEERVVTITIANEDIVQPEKAAPASNVSTTETVDTLDGSLPKAKSKRGMR